MLANVVPQAIYSVVTNHKPQLERAEAPPEGDLPVAVIDDGTRFGGLVAQVLREDAESLDQGLAIGNVEAIAIEVGEHPLMWVEAVAVCKFETTMEVAKFGAERGGARHGGIDMQPD